MKTCSHCHTQNEDNAKFCVKCGKAFNQTSDSDAALMSILGIGLIILIGVGLIGFTIYLFQAYDSAGWVGVIGVILIFAAYGYYHNK